MDTHRADRMCAHTSKDAWNWRMGSPSHVQNVMQKIGEDNWKVGKTRQVISQAFAIGLDMIKLEHNGPQMSCWRAH